MSKTRLQELSEHGVSVWLDYLSREILHNGKLAQMMDRDAVVGVTSNPTIFQKALSSGDEYDEQLKELLQHEDDGKEIFLQLSAVDVKEACALLRLVWDSTDHTDGYVSWEVDPELAYERDEQAVSSERWQALAAKGATPQRCVWASTSTKNPEYRDVMYVEELIGRDTVN